MLTRLLRMLFVWGRLPAQHSVRSLVHRNHHQLIALEKLMRQLTLQVDEAPCSLVISLCGWSYMLRHVFLCSTDHCCRVAYPNTQSTQQQPLYCVSHASVGTTSLARLNLPKVSIEAGLLETGALKQRRVPSWKEYTSNFLNSRKGERGRNR